MVLKVGTLPNNHSHTKDAGMDKPKPWRMDVGLLFGLFVGALVWWWAYDPQQGFLQKPQLLIVPAALGVLIVNIRNKRRKAGPFDPEIIERNKRGTL